MQKKPKEILLEEARHELKQKSGGGILRYEVWVRIPLMADTDSTFIADSIPYDGGHPAQVS